MPLFFGYWQCILEAPNESEVQPCVVILPFLDRREEVSKVQCRQRQWVKQRCC